MKYLIIKMKYLITIMNVEFRDITTFEADKCVYSGTSREIILIDNGKKKTILLAANDRVVIEEEERSNEDVPF